MTKLDEVACAIAESCGEVDGVRGVDWKKAARAALEALKVLPEPILEVGHQHTADPCWPEDVQKAVTAMIDHILSEGAET